MKGNCYVLAVTNKEIRCAASIESVNCDKMAIVDAFLS